MVKMKRNKVSITKLVCTVILLSVLLVIIAWTVMGFPTLVLACEYFKPQVFTVNCGCFMNSIGDNCYEASFTDVWGAWTYQDRYEGKTKCQWEVSKPVCKIGVIIIVTK